MKRKGYYFEKTLKILVFLFFFFLGKNLIHVQNIFMMVEPGGSTQDQIKHDVLSTLENLMMVKNAFTRAYHK